MVRRGERSEVPKGDIRLCDQIQIALNSGLRLRLSPKEKAPGHFPGLDCLSSVASDQ